MSFLVACSSNDQAANNNESNDVADEVAVIPNKILSLDIDGMVCKMGCGGSIRKELKATKAVSSVEFDFDEERTTNFAKVYFDDSKISKEKLIKLVTSMNENQFTVGQSSMEEITETESEEADVEKSNSEVSSVEVDTYSPVVEVPNIFELLSSFIL